MGNPFKILDERLSNIENILQDNFNNQKKQNYQPQTENPLGIKDVSKLIGKTVPTIYGYCQRNEIPYSKNGNRLIFWKSEIIKWLKQGKVKTIQEIEANADAFLSNRKKGLK
ncbi:MAG: putative DNA-binding transcriptional regulator AlpA [Patiriisocius sp.]|jgi:predicted DNA-binding transcriptional regulator AlpA